jgi:Ca2+-binding RTX toxin-like protein
MPIEAVSQTTEGHVYILYGNDDLNVAAGVTIKSSTTDAVTTWDGQHKFTVAGTILGFDDGINTIGTTLAQTVEIAASGRITTANDGSIVDADGVILDGVNSTLVNAGVITAQGSAASLFVRDGGTTTITNSGTMTGTVSGIWNKFGSGTLVFNNTGTLESPNQAYRGGIYVDIVTNKGIIHGLVDLSGGNDVYDGRGGSVVGQILGGDGDDRFVLGTSAETIDGGYGNDTLDLSSLTTAVTVDLGNTANNKGASVIGDKYSNIETILGSTIGDRLTGDAMNNTLIGNGGRDTMYGAAGDDTLDGGAGRDALNGGTGADIFVFKTYADRADNINDFEANIDHIVIEGSAYGYGDYAGAVSADDFITRTTNAALDASDRFIFRTTDKTLWFDKDGLGGAAAVLLADLQSTASLSASDLLIV